MCYIVLLISYAVMTLYASAELTRYIFAWRDAYGELPPGSVFSFDVELVLIWVSWLVGIGVVALLLGMLYQSQNNKEITRKGI